jgi:hypothetical protein
LILSPPTVNLVRFGSAFSDLTVQRKLPYVTSFLRVLGTSDSVMKRIVSVGFLIRPPTPCARRPNSLADETLQSALYLGCCNNCQ